MVFLKFFVFFCKPIRKVCLQDIRGNGIIMQESVKKAV